MKKKVIQLVCGRPTPLNEVGIPNTAKIIECWNISSKHVRWTFYNNRLDSSGLNFAWKVTNNHLLFAPYTLKYGQVCKVLVEYD